MVWHRRHLVNWFNDVSQFTMLVITEPFDEAVLLTPQARVVTRIGCFL